MADPIHITDADDPRIDLFRDVRDRDLRGHDGVFMAESEIVLHRLVLRPERLHAVLLSPAKHARLADALRGLPDGIPVYVADLELMTRIAGFHVHRGVLALGRRQPRDELSLDNALGHLRGREDLVLLLAESLTNVDNIGGLFRNAAAFGADGIVLDPACCDPLYRKAIRVSVGHVLSVPYAVSGSWPDDLARLKVEWGITLVGAESQADAAALWTLPPRRRVGLLFGSEARGLSPGALAACDSVCEIPMAADVPSLNVTNAAAVFLYEVRRRRATTSDHAIPHRDA